MLSDDDIDQELPLEVDDEYITKDAILPMPAGTTSLYAASNAHTRLMQILAKVIKYIYPTKGLEQSVQGSATSSYVISNTKIREIEQDLANWLDKLPMALRPGGEGTPEVLRLDIPPVPLSSPNRLFSNINKMTSSSNKVSVCNNFSDWHTPMFK
jgi:hypothetical protein